MKILIYELYKSDLMVKNTFKNIKFPYIKLICYKTKKVMSNKNKIIIFTFLIYTLMLIFKHFKKRIYIFI